MKFYLLTITMVSSKVYIEHIHFWTPTVIYSKWQLCLCVKHTSYLVKATFVLKTPAVQHQKSILIILGVENELVQNLIKCEKGSRKT